MHNVSQWPNLRHLGEPLGGAEGLQEAVSFKKVTENMGRGRVAKLCECHMGVCSRLWELQYDTISDASWH